MSFIKINNKISNYNEILSIEGDKSLSIRWALLASQSHYKSKSQNLLLSEDVMNTLDCLKKNTYDQFYNEHIYVFSLILLVLPKLP